MNNFSIFVFISFAFLSSINTVQAENVIMNAVSLQTLPSSRAIQVRPLDVSIDNLALQKATETKLSKRGHKVPAKAPLIVKFTSRDQVGNWSSNSKCKIFSLQSQTGRGHEGKIKARVNIYQSVEGGLLNEGKDQRESSSGTSQYRLDVTLKSQSNGAAYWNGWSTANLKKSDRYSLTKQMIPPIIKSIGQTVHHQEPMIK